MNTNKSDIYLICNRDKVLASFILNNDDNYYFKDIYCELPNFIKNNIGNWLKSRIPPKNRENMFKLLNTMGISSIKEILDYSKGLSLNDNLWIKKENENLKWENVNLYINDFDETISTIAFDGSLPNKKIKTISPEFSTNGALPKCWVREKDDNIYLKKAGTDGACNTGNEPYSEVLATEILEVLGYNHVPYKIEKFRGKIVSSCKLITSEQVSMIPIYMLCDKTSIYDIIDYYNNIACKDDIIKMLIFDYLILNSDRHLNNFAVMVNSNTFEPITMAPIYDNGVGMLSYYVLGDDFDEYKRLYIPALYDSYEEITKYCKYNLQTKHNVENLINFKFDRSRVFGYSEERLNFIENFIQERVEEFLSW